MPNTAENVELVANGTLRLRQRPGPNNSLGLVKFMLPNAYNVYLHSTPAQSLSGKRAEISVTAAFGSATPSAWRNTYCAIHRSGRARRFSPR
jgi:hypothetical protein